MPADECLARSEAPSEDSGATRTAILRTWSLILNERPVPPVVRFIYRSVVVFDDMWTAKEDDIVAKVFQIELGEIGPGDRLDCKHVSVSAPQPASQERTIGGPDSSFSPFALYSRLWGVSQRSG